MKKDEYFCLKCMKAHSDSYNVHKEYAFELQEVLEKLAFLEKRSEQLTNRVNDILELLDLWAKYIGRKHPYYKNTNIEIDPIG